MKTVRDSVSPHSLVRTVGFSQITEAFATAPFARTRPEGWLAQSLTDTELAPLKGSSRCAEALSNPVLWFDLPSSSETLGAMTK